MPTYIFSFFLLFLVAFSNNEKIIDSIEETIYNGADYVLRGPCNIDDNKIIKSSLIRNEQTVIEKSGECLEYKLYGLQMIDAGMYQFTHETINDTYILYYNLVLLEIPNFDEDVSENIIFFDEQEIQKTIKCSLNSTSIFNYTWNVNNEIFYTTENFYTIKTNDVKNSLQISCSVFLNNTELIYRNFHITKKRINPIIRISRINHLKNGFEIFWECAEDDMSTSKKPFSLVCTLGKDQKKENIDRKARKYEMHDIRTNIPYNCSLQIRDKMENKVQFAFTIDPRTIKEENKIIHEINPTLASVEILYKIPKDDQINSCSITTSTENTREDAPLYIGQNELNSFHMRNLNDTTMYTVFINCNRNDYSNITERVSFFSPMNINANPIIYLEKLKLNKVKVIISHLPKINGKNIMIYALLCHGDSLGHIEECNKKLFHRKSRNLKTESIILSNLDNRKTYSVMVSLGDSYVESYSKWSNKVFFDIKTHKIQMFKLSGVTINKKFGFYYVNWNLNKNIINSNETYILTIWTTNGIDKIVHYNLKRTQIKFQEYYRPLMIKLGLRSSTHLNEDIVVYRFIMSRMLSVVFLILSIIMGFIHFFILFKGNDLFIKKKSKRN